MDIQKWFNVYKALLHKQRITQSLTTQAKASHYDGDDDDDDDNDNDDNDDDDNDDEG